MNHVWHWTNATCNIQAVILENGVMAVVHDPNKTRPLYWETDRYPDTAMYVNLTETVSHFSVHWEKNTTGDDQYPSLSNECGFGACAQTAEGSCLCDTTVEEVAVFDALPQKEDVETQLTVGAFAPDTFPGSYTEFVPAGADGSVKVFHPTDLSPYTTETIFEVVSKYTNTPIYLKNVKSTVTVSLNKRFFLVCFSSPQLFLLLSLVALIPFAILLISW